MYVCTHHAVNEKETRNLSCKLKGISLIVSMKHFITFLIAILEAALPNI